MDEEFFGADDAETDDPVPRPSGDHLRIPSQLALVHSIGAKGDAKGGKLESVRPFLSYIARSYVVDKVWEKQRDAVIKQLLDAYNRNLAAGYAQIEAAGRLSRSISANNDAMIKAMDASLPNNVRRANATRTSSPSETPSGRPRISTSTSGAPRRWRIPPGTSRNSPACTAITGRMGSEITCIPTIPVSTPIITPMCPTRS